VLKPFGLNKKWVDKNGLVSTVKMIGDEKILHKERENIDLIIDESDQYRIRLLYPIGLAEYEAWLCKKNGIYHIKNSKGHKGIVTPL